MYSQMSITNIDATNFDFTVGITASVVNGGVSAESLGFEYQFEGDTDPKGQDAGNHPSPMYAAQIIATLRGKIVGAGSTDALALADYWTRRGALMSALLVDDGPQTTEFHHGVLKATPQGGSQFYANVVVMGINCGGDINDGSNRISFYTVTWRIDRGALLAVSGDTVVKL